MAKLKKSKAVGRGYKGGKGVFKSQPGEAAFWKELSKKQGIEMDPKVMERYRKIAKAPLAKKVVKKTAKKGIGKKIVSKLGVPGKVIAGAWAAYDVVKGLSDADKESVSTSAKCQKRGGKWVKGKCVFKKSAKTTPSAVSKRPTPR